MGLFSWLFGKKKKKYDIEDSDGQEQYFKSDFDEPVKKNAQKTEKPDETAPKKATVDNKTEQKKDTPKKATVESKKAEVKKTTVKKATTEKAVEKQKTVEEKKNSPAPAEIEVKDKKTGRFEIKKAKDGRFVFNLYAPNHIIVATSQVYSSSSAAVNGIQSIIANAEKAPIEDNTLKNPTKQSYPKWEMYIDKGGEYRFRLYATNGNCVVHSQGYKQKSSCKNGIDSIIRCAKNAEIDKSYLKKD
ncbi:MAG: DUF1508 domain-containing protein [Ruminococcaceae bacterium]|nr:DUF1508 domain-containing protein [Oscillospiraceae bacterium]